MAKVVIDTNVLVSSFLSRDSFPALVFRHLRSQRFELVVSRAILDEYTSVLQRQYLASLLRMTEFDIHKALSAMEKKAIVIEPTTSLHGVTTDPKDDKFVECAASGGADFIVSGDRHLLVLGSYEGTRIVSPAVFVSYLESESPEE